MTQSRAYPTWLRVAGGFATIVAVTVLLGQGGFIDIPAVWLKPLGVVALLMTLAFAVIVPRYRVGEKEVIR